MVFINPKNKKNFDRDQFIKDYEELKSACRMAEKYNCCKQTILEYARKFGYVNHYRPELTQEQKEYIITNYEYKTSPELAKELGVSSALIGKVWSEGGKKGKSSYQYYYDKDFFHEINAPEKAYFLGLMAADGNVFKRGKGNSQTIIKISLQSCDEKVLEKFGECLNSNKPLSHGVRKGENFTTSISVIEFVSDTMGKDLAQWGIVPRKTYPFITPDIPKELYSHYFRGYFDGDGSIFFNKQIILPSQCSISIAGFKHNMEKMVEILKEFNIQGKYVNDNRKEKQNKFNLPFGHLRFNNIREKYFFLKYIYQDCGDLYIDRKKEKANLFFDAIENNIGNKENLYLKIKQECRFQ